MAGFSRAGAVEALREIAPRVPLIVLHERPSDLLRASSSSRAQFAAVLPRSLAVEDFMYAVECALSQSTNRRRRSASKQAALPQEEPARNNQHNQGNF
jgi:DNA-binding NarL/FixJ family response regulator